MRRLRRSRLDRLEERASLLRDEITLPDGARLPLAPGERLEAFDSLMDGREHRLLDVARQVGTNEGFLGFLWVIQPGSEEERTHEE
jgi:hypothetical protein